MKLALVHDDLIQFGGAERLLLQMHKIWPDAPIYTSVASKKWLERCKKEGITLKTSFMQKLPFVEKLNRVYAPFHLHALAFESFDFSEFDVVLSVSARFAHLIITKPTTKHICYMNSPGRMIWEPLSYFENETFGGNKCLKKLSLGFLKVPLSSLRMSDYTAAQRVDYFIANSKTPQARIKKYYSRSSYIIHPFVNCDDFKHSKPADKGHFLVISRLVPWKRVDLAVRACSELGLPLKVIGRGSDIDNLQKIAGPSVEFLGYVSEEEKVNLLANCRALINTQYEDFGIVPLEAMASGKPVIAYGKGGVLETVISGENGVFFDTQDVASLKKILATFDPEKFDEYACKQQAKKFDKCIFNRELKRFVECVALEN